MRIWIVRTLLLLGLLLPLAGATWITWSQGEWTRRDAMLRELVNLEGNPRPEAPARSIRVVVVDTEFALQWPRPGFRWPNSSDYFDAVESLAHRLYDTQGDIIVLYDVLLESPRTHELATGEIYAVEAQRPWRVESTTWTRRYAPLPLNDWNLHPGPINAGHIVLSRFPITDAQFTPVEPRGGLPWAESRWGEQGGVTRVVVQSGPEQLVSVVVIDDLGQSPLPEPEGEFAVVVARGRPAPEEGSGLLANDALQLHFSPAFRNVQSRTTGTMNDTVRRPILLIDLGIAPDVNLYVPPENPAAGSGAVPADGSAAP